jgi:hypothetical protein
MEIMNGLTEEEVMNGLTEEEVIIDCGPNYVLLVLGRRISAHRED